MGEGIEVFGGDAGHAHQVHALIGRRGVADVVGAVIDRDGVAAPRQPRTEVLGAGLETRIRRRHAARADQGDMHQYSGPIIDVLTINIKSSKRYLSSFIEFTSKTKNI